MDQDQTSEAFKKEKKWILMRAFIYDQEIPVDPLGKTESGPDPRSGSDAKFILFLTSLLRGVIIFSGRKFSETKLKISPLLNSLIQLFFQPSRVNLMQRSGPPTIKTGSGSHL